MKGVRREEMKKRKRRIELEYKELEKEDRKEQLKKREEKIKEFQYNK